MYLATLNLKVASSPFPESSVAKERIFAIIDDVDIPRTIHNNPAKSWATDIKL